MTRPLAGITVFEVVSPSCPIVLRLAAAMAGRVAADLGATVVKPESPEGDPVRRLPPMRGTGSAMFDFLTAGKRIVTTASANAQKICDSVITDDAAEPDHASFEGTRVVLSLFARGHGGGVQSEFTLMALGGLLDIVGDPQRAPLRLGGHQLAYAAGLAAYAGMAAGLLRRPARETARVAVLEVAVWLNWKSVAGVAALGEASSRAGRSADWPVLRCADGHVAVVYQPEDFSALCRLLAAPELTAARFADVAGRRANAAALADIMERELLKHTRRELLERAMALRLPLGPVWTLDELRDDPQLRARDFLQQTGPRLPVIWNHAAVPA